MSTDRSVWRARARRVIAGVLRALPAGTSREEKRKAVAATYPFGPREHHPYRCWLAELRQTGLASRRVGTGGVPIVRVRVDTASGEPIPCVDCGWCNKRVDAHNVLRPGCLACSSRRHAVATRHVNWTAWADWDRLLDLKDEPLTRQAFADWLEENGWPEDAALVRQGD